jgi:hypothetical protein
MVTVLETCGLLIVALIIFMVISDFYQGWRDERKADAIMTRGGPRTLQEYRFLFPKSCSGCGGHSFTLEVEYIEHTSQLDYATTTRDTRMNFDVVCTDCGAKVYTEVGIPYGNDEEFLIDYLTKESRLSPYTTKHPTLSHIIDYPFDEYKFARAYGIMQGGGPKTLVDYRFLFPHSCVHCGGREFIAVKKHFEKFRYLHGLSAKPYDYYVAKCKRCNFQLSNPQCDYDPKVEIDVIERQFNEAARASPFRNIPGVTELEDFPIKGRTLRN